MSLPCQRHLFDLPEEVAYLNCAYMGPLARRVLSAGIDGLSRKARPWSIEPSDFFTPLTEARRLFGELIAPTTFERAPRRPRDSRKRTARIFTLRNSAEDLL